MSMWFRQDQDDFEEDAREAKVYICSCRRYQVRGHDRCIIDLGWRHSVAKCEPVQPRDRSEQDTASELAEVERLLASTPAEDVIDRASLEARLAVLKGKATP